VSRLGEKKKGGRGGGGCKASRGAGQVGVQDYGFHGNTVKFFFW